MLRQLIPLLNPRRFPRRVADRKFAVARVPDLVSLSSPCAYRAEVSFSAATIPLLSNRHVRVGKHCQIQIAGVRGTRNSTEFSANQRILPARVRKQCSAVRARARIVEICKSKLLEESGNWQLEESRALKIAPFLPFACLFYIFSCIVQAINFLSTLPDFKPFIRGFEKTTKAQFRSGRSSRPDLSPAAHSCDADNAGAGAVPGSPKLSLDT